MPTNPDAIEQKRTTSKPAKPPEIAGASIPDMLASLHVNPDTGLARAEVEARQKKHGYNEVAERKSHPVRKFLGKFWGISAWMLELILILSAVLGKYSDLVIVGALVASRRLRCARHLEFARRTASNAASSKAWSVGALW